jgi:uncharacterized protein (DUF58 family)
MPTTRGWAALGAGAALFVLWIGFGEQLLLGAAMLLLLAVGVGWLYVRRIAPRVAVGRAITPIQVHDGDRAIVELSLSSSRRLWRVSVADDVEGLGSATFVADHVDEADPMAARYEVLCRPRGVYKVGPSRIVVRDALALAEAGGTAGTIDRLVVYPGVEELDGLPIVRGQDPNGNTSQANFSQTGGEDFFTLREYRQGDDLRRVHWPSSAKRDTLMIRQLEMPWQSRATVLLDIRSEIYPDQEVFELAVRGAASAVTHLFGAGFSPTLSTVTTPPSVISNAESYRMAMENLATIQPKPYIDIQSVMSKARRSGVTGGALVLVTGIPDESDVGVFRLLGRDYLKTVVMSVTDPKHEVVATLRQAGAIPVVTPPGSRWSAAWRDAMERAWSTATAG